MIYEIANRKSFFDYGWNCTDAQFEQLLEDNSNTVLDAGDINAFDTLRSIRSDKGLHKQWSNFFNMVEKSTRWYSEDGFEDAVTLADRMIAEAEDICAKRYGEEDE